ncbi:pseudouridine synthase [Synechococcales cyanobacterium C]|uniref:Pseudouridine synthase n=1 Tax=Petrachloros mirabilis ULC683 TaxID=2781853 RepID=A0A8K2A9D7_9CYAN|nr:pseudouridine synthase [Petrachloros mirabilis]NCJ08169.1 pseudouridine synthase [Petrachloros mirabilis ULC683]
MNVRLQKVLAQWGVASRRRAEVLIQAGLVQVNGGVAALGQKVDPSCDRIQVDGQDLHPPSNPRALYLLLHKPVGVVTTCYDPQQRRTVLDLLPALYRCVPGVHPVGRLDFNSSGALLLTNDGQWTFALTHPRHHIPKTYWVWVQGNPSNAVLRQWRQGVSLDGRVTQPAQIRVVRPYQSCTQTTSLEIILKEGRNRQIRRVAEQLGHPVVKLHRTHIGQISLQRSDGTHLPPGACRLLTPSEVQELQPSQPIHPHQECVI